MVCLKVDSAIDHPKARLCAQFTAAIRSRQRRISHLSVPLPCFTAYLTAHWQLRLRYCVLVNIAGSLATNKTTLSSPVVLYSIASAPPIINAVLFATGVSSVVYRFLGGMQGAKFGFGGFRVTGSLAALLGTAYFVNYYLQIQSLSFISAEGRYDWQYSAGGWKGYIDVDKDGNVLVDMNRFLRCGDKQQTVPLLRQMGPGKVKEFEDYTRLRVSIPVQFAEYNSDCSLNRYDDTTTLAGILERQAAFTGQVEYHSKYGAPLGGMFLVKADD